MEISPILLLNPGIVEYDEKRRKEIEAFKKAVEQSKFLNNEQRRKWKNMAYLLSDIELAQGKKLAMLENLHRLKAEQKLERLRGKEK